MNRSPYSRKLVIDTRQRLGMPRCHPRMWLLQTVCALAPVVMLLASCARAVASADFFPRLAEVRRVYVAPLGSSVDAESVRDRVRRLLSESSRFTIVDEASAADAVFGGVAGVKKVETSITQVGDATGIVTSNETNRVGYGRLRLVAAGSSDTVWSFEYRIGLSREKPATRVANQAVQHLLADAAGADSVSAMRHPREPPR